MTDTIIVDVDGTLVDSNTYAVRTGGFSAEELSAAGAVAVYDCLAALQADLDRVAA